MYICIQRWNHQPSQREQQQMSVYVHPQQQLVAPTVQQQLYLQPPVQVLLHVQQQRQVCLLLFIIAFSHKQQQECYLKQV